MQHIKKNIGVKVLNSAKICTEVKVEVGEKNNTLVNYRYRILVLTQTAHVRLADVGPISKRRPLYLKHL